MSLAEIARNEYAFAKQRQADPRSVWGIPWGYKKLDEMTGGIHKEEMTIFAARPGVGKTSFLVQVALNVAHWLKENRPGEMARLISQEVSAQVMLRRMASMTSGLPMGRMRSGRISTEELAAYRAALVSIASLPLDILDSTDSLETTERFIRAKDGPPTAWWGLDYLGIHPVAKGYGDGSPYGAITKLSSAFRAISKEIAPSLILCQMSRASVKREDKRPQLADARDSGAIENDATNFFAPYREDMFLALTEEQRNEPQRCELWILKQRNGIAPWMVPMVWNPPAMAYEDDD